MSEYIYGVNCKGIIYCPKRDRTGMKCAEKYKPTIRVLVPGTAMSRKARRAAVAMIRRGAG